MHNCQSSVLTTFCGMTLMFRIWRGLVLSDCMLHIRRRASLPAAHILCGGYFNRGVHCAVQNRWDLTTFEGNWEVVWVSDDLDN